MLNENNVCLCGELISPPVYSHSSFGENYFSATLKVMRKSGFADYLPLTFPFSLMPITDACVCVCGTMRSYNRMINGVNRLIITVFVKSVSPVAECGENSVLISGYICRPPTCRRTPKGRQISDLMIAVNRYGGKTDYLPVICWGGVAQAVATLPVGTLIRAEGRLQSREYEKLTDGHLVIKTVYELSASSLCVE